MCKAYFSETNIGLLEHPCLKTFFCSGASPGQGTALSQHLYHSPCQYLSQGYENFGDSFV